MSPSPRNGEQLRGYVIPIGGAEERTGSMRVLRRFVKLCGGGNARIVIIPTASELENTGDRYVDIFTRSGVKQAISLPITERADASRLGPPAPGVRFRRRLTSAKRLWRRKSAAETRPVYT